MKGSYQANLRSFPKYSHKSVRSCGSGSDAGTTNPAAAACKLALARGKTGVVRVGGGELWDDLYRAVIDWNAKEGRLTGRAYEVVGGGAGTVSAVGGWLQGGGLSTGIERMYGGGVDQVLEIEMILADGSHVKFGPSQWKSVEGRQYPQTTEVRGLCNVQPAGDESQWMWVPCTTSKEDSLGSGTDLFGQLWYAVRGGGGGTYGVVTAVTYQLHDIAPASPSGAPPASHPGYQQVGISADAGARLGALAATWTPEQQVQFESMFYDFHIDFLWDPASLGVSEHVSNGCGHASVTFSLLRYTGLCCKSAPGRNSSGALLDAWAAFVRRNMTRPLPVHPPLGGHGYGHLDIHAEAEEAVGGSGLGLSAGEADQVVASSLEVTAEFNSFPEIAMSKQGWVVPVGHVPDSPPPLLEGQSAGAWSAAVPTEWLLQKNADVHEFLRDGLAGAHVVGGRVGASSDGMTAWDDTAMRDAALEVAVVGPDAATVTRYRNLMRPFRSGYVGPDKQASSSPSSLSLSSSSSDPPSSSLSASASASYPPDTEYNHVSNDYTGPMRGDWDMACSTGTLTRDEQADKCVSVQETVWGAGGLARLSAIKARVDPTNLFKCYRCVGGDWTFGGAGL
jgi:hypothetical protein